MATPGAARQISKSEVLEDYTASDHQHISFQMGCVLIKTTKTRNGSKLRTDWNAKKLDTDQLLRTTAKKGEYILEKSAPPVVRRSSVECLKEKTMNVIVIALN